MRPGEGRILRKNVPWYQGHPDGECVLMRIEARRLEYTDTRVISTADVS